MRGVQTNIRLDVVAKFVNRTKRTKRTKRMKRTKMKKTKMKTFLSQEKFAKRGE